MNSHLNKVVLWIYCPLLFEYKIIINTRVCFWYISPHLLLDLTRTWACTLQNPIKFSQHLFSCIYILTICCTAENKLKNYTYKKNQKQAALVSQRKEIQFLWYYFFFPTLTTWTSHYYSLFFLRSSSADYEAIITTELWILFLSSSIKRQSLQSTGIFSYINKFLFEVHIFIHAFQWDPSLFYHIHRSFKTCTHLHKSNRHTTNIMHNIFFPKILCILEPY